MAVMWEGRFSKPVDQLVNEFNASIHFDKRLYAEDIEGSLVHACMLARQKIISCPDYKKISDGLNSIKEDIDAGKIDLDNQGYEDIHMAVEQILTERIGPAGKRLHTGRSRNDQVALDMRLYVRKTLIHIRRLLITLIDTLSSIAKQHTETIMPGYTHLQPAQPVTFAQVMLAYAFMFKRDARRISNTLELMDECPLGSGALAGSTYPLDREWSARQLGFEKPCSNSMDGVSDRDYVLEALFDFSAIIMHLSRLSEEIVIWNSWEFKFIELDDAYATGSSIMPQKKNPDICELIRGKTGRVYGDLMQLLTTMKGLPLAYNKDMQEDKESFFDAADTIEICLRVLVPMLQTMEVRKDNMEKRALIGYMNATDLADYLVGKGMPFRDAYKISGRVVAAAQAKNAAINDLSWQELLEFSELFEEDVFDVIDLHACLNRRNTYGAPGQESQKKQIEEIDAFTAGFRSQGWVAE